MRLIDRHERTIRAFVASRSGPTVLRWATIEDLYQQTVVHAIASAKRYQHFGDASFIRWVCTIAQRTITETAERARPGLAQDRLKRPASSGVGVSLDEIPAAARTASSIVGEDEQRRILRAAIAELPHDQRLAVTLCRVEGVPLGEVAERLHRTRKATGELLSRANRALARELRFNDGFERF